MTAPFRPRKVSARAARGSAYTVPGPSLFEGPNALRRSVLAPMTDAGRELVAQITASWAAHAAAGEYPAIVGRDIQWRKVAGEQVAA